MKNAAFEFRPVASMASRQAVGAACFCLFLAWTLHQVFVHVPWRDELQALMIAREATGLSSLHQNLEYEGYPALWHLILFAVTRVRGDPGVLPWVQAPIAGGILALLWFASPFALVEKILLSAGYYISFEYAVLARPYGLGVLLFFAAIACRRSGWVWIILGLMANVSLHFLALGGIMGAFLLWRGPRAPIGIAACLVMAGIAILTGWPAPDMLPSLVMPRTLQASVLYSLMQMSGALLPMTFAYGQIRYWDALLYEIGQPALIWVGLLVPFLAVASLRRRPDLAMTIAAFCVAMIAIGLLFINFDRHNGLIFILLVGLCWVMVEEGGKRSAIWYGWLVASAIAGIWTAYWSTGVPFSEGRAMAGWVRSNGLAAQPWAAYPGVSGVDLSAYLNIRTYNVEAGRWNSFIRWNYPSGRTASADQIYTWLKRVPRKSFYLVSEPSRLSAETVTALGQRGIKMNRIAVFNDRGTRFPLVAYRVSLPAGDRTGRPD